VKAVVHGDMQYGTQNGTRSEKVWEPLTYIDYKQDCRKSEKFCHNTHHQLA